MLARHLLGWLLPTFSPFPGPNFLPLDLLAVVALAVQVCTGLHLVPVAPSQVTGPWLRPSGPGGSRRTRASAGLAGGHVGPRRGRVGPRRGSLGACGASAGLAGSRRPGSDPRPPPRPPGSPPHRSLSLRRKAPLSSSLPQNTLMAHCNLSPNH